LILGQFEKCRGDVLLSFHIIKSYVGMIVIRVMTTLVINVVKLGAYAQDWL